MSANERANAFTMRGKGLTLVGPELKAGDRAPDFTVLDQSFAPVNLAATGNRVRLFSVVPSLDTSVCSAQTKRFSDEAAKFEDRVGFYTFSRDLPFAAKRWCAEAACEKMATLADHVDGNFGRAYGTFVKEAGILSRAVFVIDASGVIQHAEYVLDMPNQPDYDAVIAALKKLVS